MGPFVKADSAPMVDLIPLHPIVFRPVAFEAGWPDGSGMLAQKSRHLRNFTCGWPTRCTGDKSSFRWSLGGHAFVSDHRRHPSLDRRSILIVVAGAFCWQG